MDIAPTYPIEITRVVGPTYDPPPAAPALAAPGVPSPWPAATGLRLGPVMSGVWADAWEGKTQDEVCGSTWFIQFYTLDIYRYL